MGPHELTVDHYQLLLQLAWLSTSFSVHVDHIIEWHLSQLSYCLCSGPTQNVIIEEQSESCKYNFNY